MSTSVQDLRAKFSDQTILRRKPVNSTIGKPAEEENQHENIKSPKSPVTGGFQMIQLRESGLKREIGALKNRNEATKTTNQNSDTLKPPGKKLPNVPTKPSTLPHKQKETAKLPTANRSSISKAPSIKPPITTPPPTAGKPQINTPQKPTVKPPISPPLKTRTSPIGAQTTAKSRISVPPQTESSYDDNPLITLKDGKQIYLKDLPAELESNGDKYKIHVLPPPSSNTIPRKTARPPHVKSIKIFNADISEEDKVLSQYDEIVARDSVLSTYDDIVLARNSIKSVNSERDSVLCEYASVGDDLRKSKTESLRDSICGEYESMDDIESTRAEITRKNLQASLNIPTSRNTIVSMSVSDEEDEPICEYDEVKG